MMKKLRLALCGCQGKVERFGSLINGFEESEVAAVWDDRREERARRVSASLNCAYERDYEKLLREYDLDGVVITTENAFHAQMIQKACAAGIHVFVEKPLCVSVEEAKRVQEAVHSSGVKFFMTDPFVHHGTVKVKQLIDSGALGRITGASFRISGAAALDRRVNYDKASAQGGIMADVGGHMIHKAHYLFGKPEAISSCLSYYTREGKRNGIEENAVIVMQYPRDLLVTMEASWVSGANSDYEAVYGTLGTAIVEPYGSVKGQEKVTLKTGRDTVTVFSGEAMPPMPKPHIRYFIDMILQDLPNDIIGKDPLSNAGVSIDNAVEYVEIIDAIYKNANAGFRPV